MPDAERPILFATTTRMFAQSQHGIFLAPHLWHGRQPGRDLDRRVGQTEMILETRTIVGEEKNRDANADLWNSLQVEW